MLIFLRYVVICLSIILPSVGYCFPFDPVPSDKSIGYLGALFGPQVGVVSLAAVPANPVIVNMFQMLNSIILVVGILALIYIGIFSTFQTAGEGEGMGRRWTSPWAMVRSVVGLMLMFPTPGAGYSLIQVLVMYVITQGIGVANEIWGLVLNQLEQGVSLSGGVKANTTRLESNAETLTMSMLNAVVCAETLGVLSQSTPSPIPSDWPVAPSTFVLSAGSSIKAYSVYTGENDSGSSGSVSGKFNIGVKNDATYGQVCGSFDVVGSVSTSDWPSDFRDAANNLGKAREIYEAKQLALLQMYQLLKPLGHRIAENKLNPKDPLGHFMPSDENLPQPTGYTVGAVDAYVDTMVQMYKPSTPDSAVEKVVSDGKLFGWSSAGAFYFLLTEGRTQSLFPNAEVAPTTGVIPSATASGSPNLGELGSYVNADEAKFLGHRLRDAALYNAYDNPDIAESISLSGAMSGDGQKLVKAVTSGMSDAMKSFNSWISGEQDDYLSGIATLGSTIMLVAETVILLTIGIALVLSIVAGLCAAKLPTYLTFFSAVIGLWPMIVVLVGLFWALGASMAVYVPMIPYMIFSMALLGWILLVIEAMVAAPLFAFALVTPQGDKLGKAGAGMYILLGLFLRPALMVVGFAMSVILLKVVLNLIHFGMAEVFSTIDALGTLFSPIVALFMYNAFVIAVVNNVFSLIYHVPDRVLVWIGGTAEQTQANLGEVKQHFEGATKQAQSALIAAGTEAAQEGTKAIKKMSADDAKKAKKGSGAAGDDRGLGDDDDDDDDDDDGGGSGKSGKGVGTEAASVAAGLVASTGTGSKEEKSLGEKSFKEMDANEKEQWMKEKTDQLSRAINETHDSVEGKTGEDKENAQLLEAGLRELRSEFLALKEDLNSINAQLDDLDIEDLTTKEKLQQAAQGIGSFFDRWASAMGGDDATSTATPQQTQTTSQGDTGEDTKKGEGPPESSPLLSTPPTVAPPTGLPPTGTPSTGAPTSQLSSEQVKDMLNSIKELREGLSTND